MQKQKTPVQIAIDWLNKSLEGDQPVPHNPVQIIKMLESIRDNQEKEREDLLKRFAKLAETLISLKDLILYNPEDVKPEHESEAIALNALLCGADLIMVIYNEKHGSD